MATQNYDSDQVTELRVLMALLDKSGKAETSGGFVQSTVRLPVIEMATVDALAYVSGTSRNKMFMHLIKVGLEQVWSTASDDVKDQIVICRHDSLGELMHGEMESGKE